MANKLGVSERVVRYEVDKLRSSGVIVYEGQLNRINGLLNKFILAPMII